MPGTVLSTGSSANNKTDRDAHLSGAGVLVQRQIFNQPTKRMCHHQIRLYHQRVIITFEKDITEKEVMSEP